MTAAGVGHHESFGAGDYNRRRLAMLGGRVGGRLQQRLRHQRRQPLPEAKLPKQLVGVVQAELVEQRLHLFVTDLP